MEQTQQAYHNQSQKYIEKTGMEITGPMKTWLDEFSAKTTNKKILELGSGHGRDAKYLAEKGHDVLCTDVCQPFLEHLQKLGLTAQQLDLLTDDIPKTEAILANAVLLHFNPENNHNILTKCYQALPPNGILALSLKQGTGDSVTKEKLGEYRLFQYWQKKDYSQALTKAGFPDHQITTQDGWLYIMAHRSNF